MRRSNVAVLALAGEPLPVSEAQLLSQLSDLAQQRSEALAAEANRSRRESELLGQIASLRARRPAPDPEPEERWVSMPRAAKVIGISDTTLRQLLHGKSFVRRAGRVYRVDLVGLNRWWRTRTV